MKVNMAKYLGYIHKGLYWVKQEINMIIIFVAAGS